MIETKKIPLSVLDLVPIVQGGTASQALSHSAALAKHVESIGYHRYWLAEHHNMPGIASAATSVVISHIAGHTSTIRVGSGGIMLPNHAPLVIAEQFGTLEALFPGRIDLGLGRAPGTDQITAYALRRDRRSDGHDFPEQLEELQSYFTPKEEKRVRAFPGEGQQIPIWLLGSSGYSAQLAGELGLPFAFASHFSPNFTLPALQLYRDHFRPSDVLDKPYAMVAANVIAAETGEEARRLSTSMLQQFLNLIRGNPSQLPPPVDRMDDIWSPYEKATLLQQFGEPIVGDRNTVKAKLEDFLAHTQANELMIHTQIFDHQARMKSYDIVFEALNN